MICHCQKCGSEITGKDITSKIFKGKSELGFEINERVYICSKCGAEHVICPDCKGDAYHTNGKGDFYDCDTCLGMGMILTSEIYK